MFKAAEYVTESLCMLRNCLLEKAYDLSVNVKILNNLGQKMITGISLKLTSNLLHNLSYTSLKSSSCYL